MRLRDEDFITSNCCICDETHSQQTKTRLQCFRPELLSQTLQPRVVPEFAKPYGNPTFFQMVSGRQLLAIFNTSCIRLYTTDNGKEHLPDCSPREPLD
eukprot:4674011-Amphidinium_carterae.1